MIERFQYTQDVSAEEPIMFIDTHIGFDEQDGMGISGSDFMKELFELDNMGKKRICVHINSGGGSVTEGMAIFHAILNTKTPVDTYCVGIAASIAGVIFQAGKNRKIADYGTLMYHNVYNPKQESPSASKALGAMQQAIIIMVASRSGISEKQIEEMMAKTTFLGAEEAREMGMCDEVVSSGRVNKKRNYQTSDLKAMWKEASVLVNKFKNENKIDMKNIANKLGLVAEANEESVLKAIDSILNKRNEEVEALKAENESMKASMTEKDAECNSLKEENASMKAKMDEAENAVKEKEAMEVEAKATTEVENAVKVGKIKNDEAVISKWKALFKNDFDGTKEILNSIEVAAPAKSVSPIRNGFNFNQEVKKAANEEKEMEGLKNMGIKFGSMEYYNWKKKQEVEKKK